MHLAQLHSPAWGMPGKELCTGARGCTAACCVGQLRLSLSALPESGHSVTTRRRCVTVRAAVSPASPAGRQARVAVMSNPLVAADSMPWCGPHQPAVSPALLMAAFWKFLRPHTIRGTVLGTSAVRSGGWLVPVATTALARAVSPGALSHPTRHCATQVVFRALSENPGAIDFSLVPRAILGLVALLCGNGYIVGINQVRTQLHMADC